MTTLETVRGIIARVTHCGEEDVLAETALQDINADSLHWVQIIVGIENEIGVEIDFEKMKDFKTIGDLLAYVDSRRG